MREPRITSNIPYQTKFDKENMTNAYESKTDYNTQFSIDSCISTIPLIRDDSRLNENSVKTEHQDLAALNLKNPYKGTTNYSYQFSTDSQFSLRSLHRDDSRINQNSLKGIDQGVTNETYMKLFATNETSKISDNSNANNPTDIHEDNTLMAQYQSKESKEKTQKSVTNYSKQFSNDNSLSSKPLVVDNIEKNGSTLQINDQGVTNKTYMQLYPAKNGSNSSEKDNSFDISSNNHCELLIDNILDYSNTEILYKTDKNETRTLPTKNDSKLSEKENDFDISTNNPETLLIGNTLDYSETELLYKTDKNEKRRTEKEKAYNTNSKLAKYTNRVKNKAYGKSFDALPILEHLDNTDKYEDMQEYATKLTKLHRMTSSDPSNIHKVSERYLDHNMVIERNFNKSLNDVFSERKTSRLLNMTNISNNHIQDEYKSAYDEIRQNLTSDNVDISEKQDFKSKSGSNYDRLSKTKKRNDWVIVINQIKTKKRTDPWKHKDKGMKVKSNDRKSHWSSNL